MHQWEKTYGNRPEIAVYTSRPDLIVDSLSRWKIQFCWPLDSVITMLDPPKLLEKYVSRAHDRKFDLAYSHCLYIVDPTPLDLSDLYTWMDLDHTMYYDRQERFAIYRRDSNHLIKQIDVNSKPPTGVIFIDCWESNVQCPWMYTDNQPLQEDFYSRMITNLWEFNLHSFVFLDSSFNPQPLANSLKEWNQRPWSINLSALASFEKHIKHTSIKHWIVVGGHWGLCTHDKPLGFLNLLKLKQQDPSLHFYSLPDSTAKFVRNDHKNSILTTCTEDDYCNDSLNWDYNSSIAELKI